MPVDILAAEEQCGFRVDEGDVLLVRTGQLPRRNVEGPVNFQQVGGTACQAACLPLFYERGIAMKRTDISNESNTSGWPRRDGSLDSRHGQSGRPLPEMPRAKPLRVHDNHKPASAAQHHRLAYQTHRSVLKQFA